MLQRFAQFSGLAMAAVGLSHFVRPEMFESITAPAFPTNTRQHIYVNGGIETAIGLGLIPAKTRKLAVAGLIGYAAYLGVNAAQTSN